MQLSAHPWRRLLTRATLVAALGAGWWQRASALAQAQGLPMSSHLYPEVSVHLLAASPTAHWLEYVDWLQPFVEEPLRIVDDATTTQSVTRAPTEMSKPPTSSALACPIETSASGSAESSRLTASTPPADAPMTTASIAVTAAASSGVCCETTSSGAPSLRMSCEALTMPARYVVAPGGMIEYADISVDYTRRGDRSELIPVLAHLAAH